MLIIRSMSKDEHSESGGRTQRLVNLPDDLWKRIGDDAKKSRRTRTKQIEAILVEHYERKEWLSTSTDVRVKELQGYRAALAAHEAQVVDSSARLKESEGELDEVAGLFDDMRKAIGDIVSELNELRKYKKAITGEATAGRVAKPPSPPFPDYTGPDSIRMDDDDMEGKLRKDDEDLEIEKDDVKRALEEKPKKPEEPEDK